jgi:hypothetical protein
MLKGNSVKLDFGHVASKLLPTINLEKQLQDITPGWQKGTSLVYGKL